MTTTTATATTGNRYSVTVVWACPGFPPLEQTYEFEMVEHAQKFYGYMAGHVGRISGMTVGNIQPC